MGFNGMNGTIVYNTGPNGAGIGWIPGKGWGFDKRLRVSVDIRMERLQRRYQYETTDHHLVSEPLDFAITWNVWHPSGYDIVMCGRGREIPDSITEYMNGFDKDKVARLWELGERWHLNGMQAGCRHQEVVWEDSTYGRRPALYRTLFEGDEVEGKKAVGWTGTMPCSVKPGGYEYGTSWLVEVLPEGFMDQIRELFKSSKSPIYDLERMES